jgi:IS30 family transposase
MYTANGVQILVCTDRQSRFVKLERIDKRSTKEVNQISTKLLKEAGRRVYSGTSDNGKYELSFLGLGVTTFSTLCR